jgi:hypothetical protein
VEYNLKEQPPKQMTSGTSSAQTAIWNNFRHIPAIPTA